MLKRINKIYHIALMLLATSFLILIISIWYLYSAPAILDINIEQLELNKYLINKENNISDLKKRANMLSEAYFESNIQFAKSIEIVQYFALLVIAVMIIIIFHIHKLKVKFLTNRSS